MSRNKFIDALLNYEEVQIRLPATITEWEGRKRNYQAAKISGHHEHCGTNCQGICDVEGK